MRPRCSVYVGASLDGFIAGPGGDIEWLMRPEYTPEEGKGLDFATFFAGVDALVMGRNSFEKVVTFDEWYYGDKPVVVLTGRPLEVPERLKAQVRLDAGPPAEVAARLAAQGAKHLYLDGGETIRRFLRAGLVDEITVTCIPILVGDGIPLFGTLGVEVPLRLLDTAPVGNGLVQLRYEVARPPGA